MITDASPVMPLMPEEAVVVEAGERKTTMGPSAPSSFNNDENHGGALSSSPNAGIDTNDHHELQFYDPAEILDMSRELAFGYLILLTGGAVEYVAPIAMEGSSSSARKQRRGGGGTKSTTDRHAIDAPQSSPTIPPPAGVHDWSPALPAVLIPDEESTSLAYAAIVDGNVLHACFGLKAAANGRSSIPTIGGDGGGRRSLSSSIFCCFPPSSSSSSSGGGALDALQFVLPRLSKNKARMSNLVEVLMEVRDLHHEDDWATGDAGAAAAYGSTGSIDATATATTTTITSLDAAAKAPLIVRIIRAYVRCFAAIVAYHDARRGIVKRDANDDDDRSGRIMRRRRRRTQQEGGGRRIADLFCSGGIFAHCLIRQRKVDPKLEALRRDALCEIASGFRGLGEDIWQSLENTATVSAITTGMSSIEGSTTSVDRKGRR
jgi:hypothetical protein